jgi:hypothetical protein
MQVSSIPSLSPTVTPWKNGQSLTTSGGRWTAIDEVSSMDGAKVRKVYHYSTCMVEFVYDFLEDGEWWFGPLSAGHGSNSDMGGFAKLADTVGAPYRIRRSGGNPRVMNMVHNCEVCVPN